MDCFDNNESNENILTDCLQKQIDELDIITSIFCNPGELVIDDHSVTADINLFLSSTLPKSTEIDQLLASRLEYRIHLQHNGSKMSLRVELPHYYPILELAEVTLSSDIFDRQQEKRINAEIRKFIKAKLNDTETYAFEVITWIQDNLERFVLNATAEKCNGDNSTKGKCGNETNEIDNYNEMFVDFERLWIYSHHIKSKIKRTAIIKNAKDLNLTGFSLPGKPGIICVEGLEEDTQEFWKMIKPMKWHRISIRKNELETIMRTDIQERRKFSNFKEVMFTEISMDETEEVKMNMSVFMRFLEQHNCSYIKKYIFRI